MINATQDELTVGQSVNVDARSKKTHQATEEPCEVREARYCEGKLAVNYRRSATPGGFFSKSDGNFVVEAMGGRYTHRERAYIISPSAFVVVQWLIANGWRGDYAGRGLLHKRGDTTAITRVEARRLARRSLNRFRHTPESAALAVRVLFENRIALTWDDYYEQAQELKALAPARRPFGGTWLTSYHAAKLVQEQCNGPLHELPISFEAAATALGTVIPELFAEYWMTLPVGEAKSIAA